MKTVLFFLSLFVCSLAAILPYPSRCTVYSKTCASCKCGKQTCVEKTKCCVYEACQVYDNTKVECCPFECQNGGTRVRLLGKRDVSESTSLSDTVCPAEIPPPRCSCPPGFEGQCCQIENPCAGFECDDNQTCQVHHSDGKVEPFCADRCGSNICSYGEKCEGMAVVCVTAPCPRRHQCVPGMPGRCPPVDPSLITTCPVECSSDTECPGNQKCCNIGCHIKCVTPVFY
ncbi:WAP four-disulfide core domain protein 3-like [Corticium candelabrum]|uniref:WAP four-disulfide core domain protein 3-like n=1 Tax=Corticium candelabrum TaxID=121492 RepID=UPI002E26EF0A|nr:WAP four-disulfide core domain protein 3-like [Corticium candelabrum]